MRNAEPGCSVFRIFATRWRHGRSGRRLRSLYRSFRFPSGFKVRGRPVRLASAGAPKISRRTAVSTPARPAGPCRPPPTPATTRSGPDLCRARLPRRAPEFQQRTEVTGSSIPHRLPPPRPQDVAGVRAAAGRQTISRTRSDPAPTIEVAQIARPCRAARGSTTTSGRRRWRWRTTSATRRSPQLCMSDVAPAGGGFDHNAQVAPAGDAGWKTAFGVRSDGLANLSAEASGSPPRQWPCSPPSRPLCRPGCQRGASSSSISTRMPRQLARWNCPNTPGVEAQIIALADDYRRSARYRRWPRHRPDFRDPPTCGRPRHSSTNCCRKSNRPMALGRAQVVHELGRRVIRARRGRTPRCAAGSSRLASRARKRRYAPGEHRSFRRDGEAIVVKTLSFGAIPSPEVMRACEGIEKSLRGAIPFSFRCHGRHAAQNGPGCSGATRRRARIVALND